MPKKGSSGGEKRKRTKKDPNAPKRPLSSYMLFCQEERENVKKENPDLKAKEILSELGKRWKGLDDDEKKKYQDRFEEDKKRYDQEKAAYDAQKKEEGSEEESKPKKTRRSKKKKAEEEEEEE